MACYRHLVTVAIAVAVIWTTSTSAEIHRTKTIGLKNGVRSRRTSDVALETDSHSQTEEDMLAVKEDGQSTIYEVWTYSLLGSVLVGLSGIFPLLVIPLESGPALKHGAAASRLKLMLSFAVGGLLGDVFLHLLPEAWAYLNQNDLHSGHNKIGLWVINGMLMFLIIEKTFGDEHEFDPLEDTCDEVGESKQGQQKDVTNRKKRHKSNDNKKETQNNKTISAGDKKNTHQKQISKNKSDKDNIKVSGYLNLLANCIDNFTHGLAVSGSFLVSNKVGVLTTIAILLHEIPHEVGDFAILLRSGFDRWKAAKAQLLTATGGIIGAVTALVSDSAQSAGERTAWILPFTSGGFLYIALVTVVPDLLQEKHGWESIKQVLCLVGGILAMCVVTLVC